LIYGCGNIEAHIPISNHEPGLRSADICASPAWSDANSGDGCVMKWDILPEDSLDARLD
jgi:hypothetical protein